MPPSLTDVIRPEHVQFADASGWENAVRLAFAPLVTDARVTPGYVDAVVAALAEPAGTYMDLGHGFTLAHHRPESGVLRTGVGILKLGAPVHLRDDPAHPAHIIIALAAKDSDAHVDVMRVLAKALTDATSREALHSSTTPQEMLGVLIPSSSHSSNNTEETS